jgi:hypothetical protein
MWQVIRKEEEKRREMDRTLQQVVFIAANPNNVEN